MQTMAYTVRSACIIPHKNTQLLSAPQTHIHIETHISTHIDNNIMLAKCYVSNMC